MLFRVMQYPFRAFLSCLLVQGAIIIGESCISVEIAASELVG